MHLQPDTCMQICLAYSFWACHSDTDKVHLLSVCSERTCILDASRTKDRSFPFRTGSLVELTGPFDYISTVSGKTLVRVRVCSIALFPAKFCGRVCLGKPSNNISPTSSKSRPAPRTLIQTTASLWCPPVSLPQLLPAALGSKQIYPPHSLSGAAVKYPANRKRAMRKANVLVPTSLSVSSSALRILAEQTTPFASQSDADTSTKAGSSTTGPLRSTH